MLCGVLTRALDASSVVDVYTQAVLAVYARLCKDVPVQEYTTQLLKELAL